MNKMNPLSKYTKVEVLYSPLVSNNVIPYEDGVIEKDTTEFGICARSARDELQFNNPDALMNGEAVANVIENCVPKVLNARKLYVPDVELLMVGIKLATKETHYNIEVKCPECGHHGAFERDLNALMASAKLFEEVPELVLEEAGGLVLKFRPHTWEEHTAFGRRMFMEQKKARLLEESDDPDEEKMKEFSAIFETMTQLNFDMIVTTIASIETPDGDIITDKGFITEWLSEQPSYVLKKIKDVSDEVSGTGVEHSMDVGCSECGHEWTLDNLQFDPSNFFGQGF